MRTGPLLLVGLLLLVAAVWIGYSAAGPESVNPGRVAPETAPQPPTDTPEAVPLWAGTESCAECHPDITARFRKSAHALAIHEFPHKIVPKPFDGEVFVARDLEHRLGPGPWMECEGPGGERERFEVDWVVGVRRIQMFTTRMDRGRIQVLPTFLEVPAERWFDYTDFIFGFPRDGTVPPDSAYSWYGPHRNWNSRCGRCHMTEFRINYDPDEASYASTWTEPFVGCEACHGPGGPHIEMWRRLDPGPDPILNPIKLPKDRANQICGVCHSESTLVDPSYLPGDDLFRFFEVAGIEDEVHAHPDGRARELFHNLLPIMESRCGPLSCTRCHDPHDTDIPGDIYRPLDDDWMCTQCHSDIAENLFAHTHHKPQDKGSHCVDCHMPQLVIEGGHGKVFDHTISIPSIRNTQLYGLPNACRSCHNDKEPGWEYESYEKWYPGAAERNHRVPLAAAIVAARERRPGAQALLRKLLEDPSEVYRAAAAHYLGDSDVDLRPLLEDPSSYVRRAAVDGVARNHPEAAVPLLDSDNLVLARAAALALAGKRRSEPFDWIREQPEVRARVIAVLERCAELRPDHDDLHFVLAWLYSFEGRSEEAARATERYYLLKPWMRPGNRR